MVAIVCTGQHGEPFSKYYIKEVAVAEEIEKYLTESTADIAENDEEIAKFDGKKIFHAYM